MSSPHRGSFLQRSRLARGLAACVAGASLTGCETLIDAYATIEAGEQIRAGLESQARAQQQGPAVHYQTPAIPTIEFDFFACNVADPALDGKPASLSLENDIIGKREGNTVVFKVSEPISFVGGPILRSNYSTSLLKICNQEGRVIFNEHVDLDRPSTVHYQPYKASELPPGRYKALLILDGSETHSLDVTITPPENPLVSRNR